MRGKACPFRAGKDSADAEGIHGEPSKAFVAARCSTVLLSLKRHPDRAEGWLARLAARRNANIAAVALANKNARTVWALLAHGRDYQDGYRSINSVTAA
jgi:hypothetical protein